MRNLKKFLALVLAMVMTLSLMVTVNAANVEFSDSESVTEAFQEHITVLAGMGVIQGYEDGTFGPQRNVTRAQMAAFVYRIATGDADDKYVHNYVGYNTFSDVNNEDWFAGYIGYCANAGYIVGYPDGSFKPHANVTGYAALAMILRAMGYNEPGHKFEGAGWETYVSSTATQRGMLVNVNQTNYKNSLKQAAPRELVAELTFQGADKAQVQYTPAFGYQTTGMTGGLLGSSENPSLGWQYYGLTSIRSVIVGNEATGEDGTRLGQGTSLVSKDNIVYSDGYPVLLDSNTDPATFVYKYLPDGSENSAYAGAFSGSELASDLNSGFSYVTTSNQEWATSGHYEYSYLNSLYDYETGLDKFAHEVTIWFNATNYTNGKGYETYALIDRVKSDDAFFTDDNADVEDVTGATKGTVMWSDRYSQIGNLAYNATTNLSPISTYRKVVNPSGTVYIALSAEVAKITQKNSTAKDAYLILGSSVSNESSFGNGAKGTIYLDNLTPDTEEEQKKVGETITAWEIVGTSFNLAEADSVVATTANSDANRSGSIMYQLDPMVSKTITVGSLQAPGTPASIDSLANPVTRVFTTTGDELKLSGITLGDGTNSEIISEVLPIVIKTAAVGAWNIDLKANTSYVAYMDIVGRFISMVPVSDYQFLYTTYAGYQLDGFNAGTIGYNVVGVDWNAKIQAQNTLKSLTLDDDDPSNYGSANITYTNDPDAAIVNINGTLYDKITATKMDQGYTSGTAGNEILAGFDTGYMFNASTGDLAQSLYTKMYDDDIWSISSQDAVNGFKKVEINQSGTAVEYLLTKDTHFIIVSGTGTATLKVAEATGLTELLDGATSADIVFDQQDKDGKQNEVIFRTEAEKYGTAYTDDNHVITDIILSDGNLIRWNTQTLYFDYDQTADTGMVLPGTDPAKVKQYDLWCNGQKVSPFVDVTLGNGAALNLSTGDTTDSLFFTLAKAYEVNGTPVYMAVKAPANAADTAGAGIGGLKASGFAAQHTTYDYITVSNLTTGLFADSNAGDNRVLSLDNVTVCDVEWKVEQADSGKATDVLGRGEITNVLELNNAVSVGKQALSGGALDPNYKINVAVVYDNSNSGAITIYVLKVATNP